MDLGYVIVDLNVRVVQIIEHAPGHAEDGDYKGDFVVYDFLEFLVHGFMNSIDT
jgi:hypothetical protein